MNRIFIFSALVLSGKLFAAVLGLAALAIAARGLPVAEFGLLMLIVSYKQICNRVLNVQTWQAVVRYGKIHQTDNNPSALVSLLKFCFKIDFATALFGAVVAILFVYVLSLFVEIFHTYDSWFAIYALALVTNMRGYTTGVFRLYEKFHYQSAILAIAAVLKLAGASILYYYDASFPQYFILWMATDIFINATELFISRLLPGYRASTVARQITMDPGHKKDLLAFIWNAHMDGLSKILREIDSFLIAILASLEASAIYNIAKKFASVAMMYADTVYEVTFPEFAGLVHGGDINKLRSKSLHWSVISGTPVILAWALFAVIGETAIQYTVGVQYIDYLDVILVMLISVSAWAFGYPMTSILMCRGLAARAAKVNLISTVLYIGLLVSSIHAAGVIGAAWSYFFSQTVWLILMLINVRESDR